MVKDNYYQNKLVFSMSGDFHDDYGGYFHAGIDSVSGIGKKQDIYNLIAGVLIYYGVARDPGNHIILKHNPKFVSGPNDFIYSSYFHLSKIDEKMNYIFNTEEKFIDAGVIIGKMGNTGNCWTHTADGKGLRKVYLGEVSDPNTLAGVHLHNQFYQPADQGNITPIIQDMINKKIIEKNNSKHYFYQWGNVYVNPNRVYDYFKLLVNSISPVSNN